MIRVAVVGAGGRMGQESCRAVIGAGDLDLVAAVDPKTAGIDLRQVLGGEVPSIQVSGHVDALVEAGAEVVVDFTAAPAARENLPWYAANGIHAVVGTTGLSEEDLADAEERFAASSANAVIAANFAIGAVLLMRFCELAAPYMEGVEVIELHHNEKVDAPSGTALRTAQRIVDARRAAGSGPLPADPTSQLVLEGARGGEAPGGVRVHSVRLAGLVAHQEVIFGTTGQTLTLRHDSYDRRSFMPGVLLAVREVPNRTGVTIGLDPLLGL
ncbi:MAG TPA: 4-hydroxy-tetrahydrodipicolinate reductase [Acidimicrobiales bacterium]|nr:4-hydroxy-tetrahydrodipicolinate reductase [Acidimicrobiales bacterium]